MMPSSSSKKKKKGLVTSIEVVIRSQHLERAVKAIQTNYHPISEHIDFSNMRYEVVPLI
jgi:hypothetical protein